MVFVAAAVTFFATTFILLAVTYALSSPGSSTAARLIRLWRHPTRDAEPNFRQKQQERAQRVLSDVGKLVPTSTKVLSRTGRRMVRAGYRRPEAVRAFQGVKLLLVFGAVSFVYFSGLHAQNALYLPIAALLGYQIPDFWLSHKVSRRQHRIQLGLPDALDLLVVCVEAGLGLDQSLMRVSEELRIAHRDLSDELQIVNLEMRVGKGRTDALRELALRTGVEDIKALVAMLIQTERFGTSIAQSLRVHSDHLRTQRRQRAEEQAAKTPVKMVPVLVFFIFPALFVVILGPAVISLARQLLPIFSK